MKGRQRMSFLKVFTASVILLVISIIQVRAQFSDGFETYVGGGVPLDKNVAGPNSAPNGSGNPWFGPAPPNLRVVASGDGGVIAHSGLQMVRGSAPSDLDED